MVDRGNASTASAGGGLPLAAVLAALLLAPLPLSPIASAAQHPPVLMDERVELRFSSADRLSMSFRFSIYEDLENGINASADAIRTTLSGPSGEAMRTELENLASLRLNETVRSVVPQDDFWPAGCTFDSASLNDTPGSDEFNPPVVLVSSAGLVMSPVSFGLPDTADLSNLAPLLLSDGARLQRNITLTVPAGHRLRMLLQSFPGAIFSESMNAELELVADNSGGAAELRRELTATLRSTTDHVVEEESARIRGRIDIPDLDNISICGTIEFQRADPSGYWTPPSGVQGLRAVSGRTLSELVRSGILSTDEIYAHAIRPVQLLMMADMEALFNLTIDMMPSWGLEGNLSCTLRGNSSGRSMFSLDPELVLGALNAGAVYSFSVPLDLGWPLELELLPPPGMVLMGLPYGSGAPSGRVLHIYRNNGTGRLEASLASAHPASGTDDVRIEVMTDFYRPKTELGKLLWTQDTDVPVFVDALLKMGILSVPSAIAGLLPSNLTLRYLTSDLVRLLLAKKLIGDPEMSAVLSELKPRIDAPIRAALGRSVQPGIRYISASLRGYDLQSMNGSRPMVIEAWASGSREKHLDLFKVVGASPGLLRLSQDFALKGVAGCNVTYRMRFAPELKLVSVDGRGAKVVRGTEDGRDFFEVSFGRAGGAANVTAFVEPAPGFLLFSLGPQLSPCFAMLIIIGVVVFIRLRKWRRRRRAGNAARPGEPARPPQQT